MNCSNLTTLTMQARVIYAKSAIIKRATEASITWVSGWCQPLRVGFLSVDQESFRVSLGNSPNNFW
jgi:hypothetical protein